MSIENHQISFMEVQFFNFSSLQYNEDSSCPQSQEETLMESENFKNQQIFIEPPSSTETGPSSYGFKTKSILHNFQKHMFTFIQSLIPKKKEQAKGDESQEEKCVKKILSLVKSQKKKTKEELVPIFGQVHLMSNNRMNPTYKVLIEEFSQQVVKQSLMEVRNNLMQKIKESSLKEYVQKSKMQKKGEFLKYMESFVAQVQDGRFGCRLSKKSQTEIKEKIKEEIQYKEWQSLIV